MRHHTADFQFEVLCKLHTSKKGSQVTPGNVKFIQINWVTVSLLEKANAEKQAGRARHKTYPLWTFCCITAAIFKIIFLNSKNTTGF